MSHRILVVDDDPAIRRLLVQTLGLENYDVETASDGEEALEAIPRVKPDVVVLDIMMPKLNGLDVLERVRREPATTNLPVILLTAKSAKEDVWEGWQKGVDYYMTKPFDVEDLLRFIQYVLAGGERSANDSVEVPTSEESPRTPEPESAEKAKTE